MKISKSNQGVSLALLSAFLLLGCSSNKNIALNDHAVKTVERNVVTMNLKTGAVQQK